MGQTWPVLDFLCLFSPKKFLGVSSVSVLFCHVRESGEREEASEVGVSFFENLEGGGLIREEMIS